MRSKLLMFMAVLAIGAGLAGIFISGQTTPEKQPVVTKAAEPEQAYFKVYRVVTAHLKRGDALRRTDLEITHIPESQARNDGIDGDSLFPLDKHAVYREEMQHGDYLLRSDIVTPDDPEFIDATIEPNHLAYAIAVEPDAIVGGIIHTGSYVDVLALTGLNNGRGDFSRNPDRNVSISPVLSHIRVLKIERSKTSLNNEKAEPDHLILEVTRKQVAQLTVAKQIAKLEVYLSAGAVSATELKANAGDVLPDFKAVRELRANDVSVK